MRFTSPVSQLEFDLQLHPDARTVAVEFDLWLQEQGMDELVITEVVRSEVESENIYLPIGLDLLQRLRTGGRLTPNERTQAMELRRLCEDGTRLGRRERETVAKWARKKFSWHKVACGWDCRDREWTPAEHKRAADWIRSRCASKGTDAPWEVITERHGTGPHFHVARRDFRWRANYKPTAPSARA